MKEITSKQNLIIKSLKKQKLKNRFLLFLDNVKTIKEAFDFGLTCETILIEKEKLEKHKVFLEEKCDIFVVSNDIIKEFSTTKTPQGIIAVFKFENKNIVVPKKNFLVLDGLQDAGNIGTLLRSAIGANFKDVFLVDCASITNDKLIRSSMSAIFRLNTYELSRDSFITFAKQNKLNLVACDMQGENIFKTNNFSEQVGLVLGSEGQGLSKEIKQICKKSVSIPMENNLESLNVGVAGAIIMFEINNKGKR